MGDFLFYYRDSVRYPLTFYYRLIRAFALAGIFCLNISGGIKESFQQKFMEDQNLSQKKCVPCEGGVPPMDKWLAIGYLKETPGWEILEEERKIKREFKFKGFRSAMVFVNKVAELAEVEQHHPNFYIFFNRVALELWTHSIGGLSENDFILAAKINNIAIPKI